jgi:hypothetical protein
MVNNNYCRTRIYKEKKSNDAHLQLLIKLRIEFVVTTATNSAAHPIDFSDFSADDNCISH